MELYANILFIIWTTCTAVGIMTLIVTALIFFTEESYEHASDTIRCTMIIYGLTLLSIANFVYFFLAVPGKN